MSASVNAKNEDEDSDVPESESYDSDEIQNQAFTGNFRPDKMKATRNLKSKNSLGKSKSRHLSKTLSPSVSLVKSKNSLTQGDQSLISPLKRIQSPDRNVETMQPRRLGGTFKISPQKNLF